MLTSNTEPAQQTLYAHGWRVCRGDHRWGRLPQGHHLQVGCPRKEALFTVAWRCIGLEPDTCDCDRFRWQHKLSNTLLPRIPHLQPVDLHFQHHAVEDAVVEDLLGSHKLSNSFHIRRA